MVLIVLVVSIVKLPFPSLFMKLLLGFYDVMFMLGDLPVFVGS